MCFVDCLTIAQRVPMSEAHRLFDPIDNRRAFELVSLKIKESIFRGVLKPGDKLPSETQLASQFNVGRQTIREALRLLELSGFIVIQKGGAGGPTIADTVLNRIRDLFLDAFRIRKVSMDELTRARSEIEKVVLSHVIEKADQSDLNALRDNVLEAEQKIQGGSLASEENIRFHKLMAQASKNHVFVIAVEAIMALVAHSLSRIGPDLETSTRVVGAHKDLLEAIESREIERATTLLEEHLLEVQERLDQLEQGERGSGR